MYTVGPDGPQAASLEPRYYHLLSKINLLFASCIDSVDMASKMLHFQFVEGSNICGRNCLLWKEAEEIA